MAKIPNQNNLADIIKNRVDEINDVVDVIIKSASRKVIVRGQANIANLKIYTNVINSVLGKDGVTSTLLSSVKPLESMAKIKLPNFILLRRNIRKLMKFVDFMGEQNIKVKKLEKLKESIVPIIGMYEEIGKLFMKISTINTPKLLGFKLFFIKLALWRISKLGVYLSLLIAITPLLVSGNIAAKMFSIFTGNLAKIFADIDSIKLGLGIGLIIKLKRIPKYIARLVNVVLAVDQLAAVIRMLKGVNDIIQLAIVFNGLANVFNAIKAIKVGMFMNIKLRRIHRTLLLLNKITRVIARIRANGKTILKLILLQTIFGQLALVYTAIILLTPLAILVIPALLILMVSLLTLKLALFLFGVLFGNGFMKKKVLKGLIFLLIVGALLTAVAALFLIITLIAVPVVKNTLYLIGFIGVVALITAMLVGIGLLMTLLTPVLPYILAGLLIMVVLIGILFIMAVALKVIQMLKLDPAIIKENVKCVLETTRMIIDVIFGSEDDTNEKESDKSWIASIIDFIGGTLKTVIQAIMAVAFLAVMVVAILLILLIAAQLRLLQELTLEPSTITKNVRLVIDTAMLVVDTLFKGKDEDAKGSKKSWIVSVIEFIGGGLVMIIQAIMAVAFLSLMLVAILFILLVAAQLRLLQELNLEPKTIAKNVETVVDTCRLVISSLFDRPDQDGTPSSKGFLIDVINFICPPLGMIIEALMAIAFLALANLAILLVIGLANQLRTLQDIELDPGLISMNVTTVIDTCQLVVDSVMGRSDRPDDPSSKGWIRTLFEWIGLGGLIQIIDCIMALAWLGMSVALINMVTMLANQLKTLQDIKLDKGKITKNTEAVCQTADAVSQCVLGRKNPIKGKSDGPLGKVLRWLFPALAEAIDMMTKMKWVSGIMSTVGVVKQVADVLMQLLDLPDVSPVRARVQYVCDTADKIVELVTSRPAVTTWEDAKSRISWMDRISRTVKEMTRMNPAGINKSTKALSGFIRLVNKIDKIDVQKLQTAERMFAHITEFSRSIRGNFKALAETINEDLMPVLEELKKIMEEIPEKLDTGFAGTAASIGAANAPLTEESIGAQVKRENPAISPEEFSKIVKERLAEQAKSNATGVEAKLDELIKLLKGDGSSYVVVDTI